jgi:transcriptional regulator with XRE-family HTH domain
MTTMIRDNRIRAGLTMQQLAERLGVSHAAVSQMEKSEAEGTIKIATLSRALDALGSRLEVLSVPVAPAAHLQRREERVSWELHRAVAIKLLANPEPVLARVPENIRRIRENVRGELPNQWLDDWARLTSTSLADTIKVMLDTSPYGIEMRQNGPFQGVLTNQERLMAITRAA